MTPFAYVGDYCPVCVTCAKPRGHGTGLHCDQHHRAWLDSFRKACTPEAKMARTKACRSASRRRDEFIGRVCRVG